MVMPSSGRRNSSSLACAADFETVAVLTVSNTLDGAGIGPRGSKPLVDHLLNISLQPPQPGTTPTPHSTRPM